jgi:biotin carboxyl carrier protein
MVESNSQQSPEAGDKQTGNAQPNQAEGSVEEVLFSILSSQCCIIGAERGVILQPFDDGKVIIRTAFPKLEISEKPPQWLRYAFQSYYEAISAKTPLIKPIRKDDDLYGQPIRDYLFLAPFSPLKESKCLAVFLLTNTDNQLLEVSGNRFHESFKLLAMSSNLPIQQRNKVALDKLAKAFQILSAVNRENKFNGAIMAFCNEVAAQWGCERASVGFIESKYTKLKAMSHTEHFAGKMQLVQDIESAMEECADQDTEILYPGSEDFTYIMRATELLSKRHGPLNILSLPLRKAEKIRAVLTLERPSDKAFTIEEIETNRLVCELVSPRLIELYDNDYWMPGSVVERGRQLLSEFLAPHHTGLKSTAIAIFVFLLIITFGRGMYKTESPFILEATYQQVVPAPFEGYIKSVEVDVGDLVEKGKTILGSLDTAELRLQLAQAKADKASYLTQAAAAMRDKEMATSQIAQANSDKAEAQIKLFEYLINHANLTVPISGTIVKGDLKRQIGAPVKTGDILFEVAPLQSLRAELMISEDQIFDIEAGQKGYLATFSYPARHIEFEVERINPIAEVKNQRNVFKVRVRLLQIHPWMRPGMEGVAKVNVGKRPYIWIWTHKVVNWIRMKLWI